MTIENHVPQLKKMQENFYRDETTIAIVVSSQTDFYLYEFRLYVDYEQFKTHWLVDSIISGDRNRAN
jgi:hypothetical protein